ncbi:MAG: recombinase family protein [Enterocloster asparagiformis]|nr:recombinase family protein [Enterocloster asparagiformis]
MIAVEDNRIDAIYARQSKFKEESLSIDTQIECAKRYASKDAKIYIDRVSGKDIVHRDNFVLLLNDIKMNKIKRVIIYKLDRFSRSFLDFVNTWEMLNKYNVKFFSTYEQFDTDTPFGETMLRICASFAEMERKQLISRLVDNSRRRVELGGWVGQVPFGMSIENIVLPMGRVQSLFPNENMHLVDEICETYAYTATSINGIRRSLNAKGIPAPNNGPWNGKTIRGILRSLAYVATDADIYRYLKSNNIQVDSPVEDFCGNGAMILGEKKKNVHVKVGVWKGVISSEVWIRNQERMKNTRKGKYAGYSKICWLTGLLICGYCERAVNVRAKKCYLYCKGHDYDICSHKFELRGGDIEKTVIKELKERIKHCATQEKNMPSQEEMELKIEIAKLDDKIDNLIKTISSGEASALTIQYINKEIESADQKKDDLYVQCQKLQQIQNKKKEMEKIIVDDLNFDEKRSLAFAYIKKITVYEENIKIEWNV